MASFSFISQVSIQIMWALGRLKGGNGKYQSSGSCEKVPWRLVECVKSIMTNRSTPEWKLFSSTWRAEISASGEEEKKKSDEQGYC